MHTVGDVQVSDDPHLKLIEHLEGTARGDRAAFRALYEATSAKLFGVVSRILGSTAEADEVVQEVYLRIWQNANRFDATAGRPITWMATIARNRALDVLRRRQGSMVSIEQSREEDGIDILGASDEVEIDGADRVALRRCLEGLEPSAQEAVILAYCQGFSREELADRYERPVGTVKTWLRRALASLKECLDG